MTIRLVVLGFHLVVLHGISQRRFSLIYDGERRSVVEDLNDLVIMGVYTVYCMSELLGR